MDLQRTNTIRGRENSSKLQDSTFPNEHGGPYVSAMISYISHLRQIRAKRRDSSE